MSDPCMCCVDQSVNDPGKECRYPDAITALEDSQALIIQAQSLLVQYLLPDSKVSPSQLINSLLECFDGPNQRKVQAASRIAIGKAKGQQPQSS